jgi:6-phosphofructokinase 1
VAQAFMGLNLDNRALPGVLVAVVMGRHAGFLTAAGAVARKYVDDGPHLIYLPERTFSQEQYLADVDRVYKEFGRCVIAVSEGIQDASGTPVLLSLKEGREHDAHGNVQLSGTGMLGDLLANLARDNLKIKRVRADTFGYLQRSYMGVVSDRDAHEARELGEIAVQYAMWDNVDGSMVRRVHEREWQRRHRSLLQLLPPADGLRLRRTAPPPRPRGAEDQGLENPQRCHCRGQPLKSRKNSPLFLMPLLPKQ